MTSKFQHIALIGKHQSAHAAPAMPSSKEVLERVAQLLAKEERSIYVEEDTANTCGMKEHGILNIQEIGLRCDLAIVVGGDGTMLGFGRQLASFGVPLIGINQGRLGFITDIALNSIEQALTPMLRGEFTEDTRSLLHAQVWRQGKIVFDTLAMNDVVLNRGATSGMVEIKVDVDGHFVAKQRADGLIIATPTGSTAYALSAGGPLLYPSLPGLLMVPIAPHTFSNRPIVLPQSVEIVMELVAGRDASVNFDMQSLASLTIADKVMVKRSDQQVKFLHPKGWSYFDTLRKKLHWNEGNS
jgi:NAD+ kinase